MWQHYRSLALVLIQIEMLLVQETQLLVYYRTLELIQDSQRIME